MSLTGKLTVSRNTTVPLLANADATVVPLDRLMVRVHCAANAVADVRVALTLWFAVPVNVNCPFCPGTVSETVTGVPSVEMGPETCVIP